MARRLLVAIRLTAIALIFLLAGVWVGSRWLERPPPVEQSPSALVDTVPGFELPDLQGQSRSLADWAGQSLLVNFWATWCAPCREEMPLLQTLQQDKAGDAFQVIGIAVDRRPAVERFIAESGITYPQLIGQQDAMAAAEAFGPPFVGLPFSVFVGPGGEVLGLRTGAVDHAELADIVSAMDAYAGGAAGLAETRAALARE